jgi:hypothetical protein
MKLNMRLIAALAVSAIAVLGFPLSKESSAFDISSISPGATNSISAAAFDDLSCAVSDIDLAPGTVEPVGPACAVQSIVTPVDFTSSDSTINAKDSTAANVSTESNISSDTIISDHPTASDPISPFPGFERNSTFNKGGGNLPRRYELGDPKWSDVFIHSLDPRSTMTCGTTTFTNEEIYESVKWAVLLDEAGQYRGRKDRKFPSGRFPHSFVDEGFTFNEWCPVNDEDRQEYPVMQGRVYNSGLSNTNYGAFRVVYFHDMALVDDAGNPFVYFCGGLTHEGAEEAGKFLQCTVELF